MLCMMSITVALPLGICLFLVALSKGLTKSGEARHSHKPGKINPPVLRAKKNMRKIINITTKYPYFFLLFFLFVIPQDLTFLTPSRIPTFCTPSSLFPYPSLPTPAFLFTFSFPSFLRPPADNPSRTCQPYLNLLLTPPLQTPPKQKLPTSTPQQTAPPTSPPSSPPSESPPPPKPGSTPPSS
jgi:hypothetical protein